MPNSSYDHTAFVQQLGVFVRQAERGYNIAADLELTLAAPMPDQYDIDHAAERLDWSIKRLRDAADSLESLKQYARH